MPSKIKASILTDSLETGQLTEISEIDYPKINEDQLLIKAVAFAANPTDWKHPVVKWGGKGDVAGSDASGIVEKVGANVKGYEVGDIVSTFMHGNYCKTRGAFGEYVICDQNCTIKYDRSSFNTKALEVGSHPSDFISTFEGAASVTLGLVTLGLSFGHNFKLTTDKKANASKSILIWGGATATGILAIQLAKSVHGLKVITTSSSQHHDFLKSLGADATFNYRDSDVVDQIKNYAGDSIFYALDTVSSVDTFQSVYDATANSKKVHLDNLLFLNEQKIKVDKSRNVEFHVTLAYCVDGKEQNLNGFIIPANKTLLEEYNKYWFDILTPNISKIKHAKLKVLKNGLESVNDALELLREEKVKGEKVVFRI